MPSSLRVLWAILLCLGIQTTTQGADALQLNANSLQFSKESKELRASGNATLEYQGRVIESDVLLFDTESEEVTSPLPVQIQDDAGDMEAESLHIYVKDQAIELKDLSLYLSVDNKHEATFQAETYLDTPDLKTGTHGYFTTCKEPEKHYYVKAASFIYHPEERLIGQNVLFYNQLGWIPFVFWTPMYIFDIGKRKVVFLMPAVGANEVEGNFFKSQFDFYFSENAYGQVYMDLWRWVQSVA